MLRTTFDAVTQVVAAIVLLLGLVVSASAQDTAQPAEATIKRIYALYGDDGAGALGDPKFVREVFSPPVAALLLRKNNRLDFDPFVSGQDFKLTDLVITPMRTRENSAFVKAKFKNMDKPTELTFELVLENGAWRITDIVSNNADDQWVLTKILRGK